MTLERSSRRPTSVTDYYDLTEPQRIRADASYHKAQRRLAHAYLLWLFGGLAGIHRHYLGKHLSGFGLATVVVMGSLTVWLDIGIAVLVFGVAIWVSDGMRMRAMVRNENEALRKGAYDIAAWRPDVAMRQNGVEDAA